MFALICWVLLCLLVLFDCCLRFWLRVVVGLFWICVVVLIVLIYLHLFDFVFVVCYYLVWFVCLIDLAVVFGFIVCGYLLRCFG